MKNRLVKWLFIPLIIFILAMGMALAFDQLGVRTENIFLLFVIAIMIVIIETHSIYIALIETLLFILSFNFFLVEPKYTFAIYDSNYLISFGIFFIVEMVVGSLVLRQQKQYDLARRNEMRINSLYKLSMSLINSNESEEIFALSTDFLSKSINRMTTFIAVNNHQYGAKIDPSEEKHYQIKYALDNNIMIGRGELKYSELPFNVFPVKGATSYGAFVLAAPLPLTQDEINYIKSMIMIIVMVLDRMVATTEQNDSKLRVEQERFKTAILRSLSHDLKTPLTAVQGGSSFLLDNPNANTETRQEIVKDIYDQAIGLGQFVENLLDLSKLSNKKLINRHLEVADDLMASTHEKIKHRIKKHKLKYGSHDDTIMVYCDAVLLTQVLVNLIDNALRHTVENSEVNINYQPSDTGIVFEVSDNGGGLKIELLEHLFVDRFNYFETSSNSRASGFGLAICHAIVEAHGGHIQAYNNDKGGATFSFNIPNRE